MYKVGVALTTLLAGTAFADLATTRIAPTVAYAPNSKGKESVSNAINGGGLNADGLTHDTGKVNSTWRSDGAPSWFVMDLGKVYSVADIKIWNYNGSKATASGLRQIDILFSVDDDAYSAGVDYSNGKWTEVVTDIELERSAGDGSNSYTGCDPIVLSSPKNARFIGFRIESTWGNVDGGLSEVRVDVVDETYSVALDGLSFDASQMSATFTGTLTATDGTGAEVFLAYGTEDAKMDLGTWENTVSCGTQASGAQFTKTISGLAADKTYYGALFVLNQSVASSWSETTNFITGVVSVRMPPNFCEAETTKRHIVFTRPASCAAEPLEISYAISGDAAADYASQLTGTAVFAAGATEAAVELTPVKDTEFTDSKTLTVTVQSGLYATGLTSSGSVTILDTAAVTAANPSWTGSASTMYWDTAGNWSSDTVPNYLDTVAIDTACSAESPVLVSQGDHAVAKVSLGSVAGGSGAIDIASGANSTFAASSGLSVGAYGTGMLEISNGTVVSSGDNVYIGSQAGATGTMTVDGNLSLASGKILYVGNSGSGMLTVKGGRISTSSNTLGDFIVGNAETGEGVLVMDGGTVSVAHAFIVGNKGHGVYTNNAGSVSGYKGSAFAKVSGSSADVCINGGSVTIGGAELVVGDAGKATMTINNGGIAHGRGITIGSAVTADGCVKVNEGGVLRSGENYTITVGASGRGVLLMRGGSVVRGHSANKFRVRAAESGYGLVSGWGSITLDSSQSSYLMNNGLIVADGKADDGTSAERSLTMSVQQSPFQNTISNDSTNGWYAVNKGLLSVAHPTFSLDVGDSGVCTWGEAEADDQIDLVNSARITFTNITTKISALTGKLYAPDRSDVPPLPSGKEAVGVWKFDITGAYESATVEFRYDHVKAPRGVQMYQLNADGTAWVKIDDTTLLEGYRAKVAVTDASRMFAAVAAKSGMSVIVR